ncbi:ABC transporter ATP-binding protein [Pacificimonas sp. WHA3]|uniref:ABC transporter ATP-binding protein n=1 Tax=Pacificimonas pallii TaxID=2827236 RepID=A0ABS6SIT5_9SPHN|nr:ABC transporter ATP-binding protein [Pacificimonas pallii]MBV7257836.1 ABC transporter ATP-binding protein [Pacificimonas pallii]
MSVIKDDQRGPIIQVEGLRNQFGSQIVHEDLDLSVNRGEIIGVVGGSGTGKTVLMRSILGLQEFAAGKISIFGKPITGLAEKEELEVRRRFGVLFQNGALFSTLTVAENVQVPLREFHSMTTELMDEIAGYKLGLAGLGPEAGPKYPSELSGGMRKRAALARALSLDPRLLFLDEPTAGLDPIGAAAFDHLILELRDALGLTVFLITHDLDTLYTICDRVAVLADRRVLAAAPIKELLEIDHPWIQDYFRGPRGRSAMAGDRENRKLAGT